MTIKKFNYAGKLREVIVYEENDVSIKGADISKFDSEEKRELWRTATKDIDMSQLSEEQQKTEYEKIKDLMSVFRHFKKSKITEHCDSGCPCKI